MADRRIILRQRNAQAARNGIRIKVVENFVPVPFPVSPIDFSDPEERWAAKILMGISENAEVVEITVRFPPIGGNKGDETDIEDMDNSDTMSSSATLSPSPLTKRQARSAKSSNNKSNMSRKQRPPVGTSNTQDHPAKKVRPSAKAKKSKSIKMAKTACISPHPLAFLKLKVGRNDNEEDINNDDLDEDNMASCVVR